jgi:hypothetical protein
MQTFLSEPTFEQSLAVLDKKRVNCLLTDIINLIKAMKRKLEPDEILNGLIPIAR